MTTVVELNVWTVAKEMETRLIRWINKALDVLLDELKLLTPEDTKDMLNSYVVKQAQNTGNWTIVWEISNTVWYAIFVEYWVKWLSFNYHKPKGTVKYSGIGNRTFARAVDSVNQKVLEIILSELNR